MREKLFANLGLKCLAVVSGLLIANWAPPQVVQAADMVWFEQNIDVKTQLGLVDLPIKTLYRSRSDTNRFYYQVPPVRWAMTDEDKPQVALFKYAFPYDSGFFVGGNVDPSKHYQGATLQADFFVGLTTEELQALEGKLKLSGLSQTPKISPAPVIGGEFYLLLNDPEQPNNGALPKIAIGPFEIPSRRGIVTVDVPLTVPAAERFAKLLDKRIDVVTSYQSIGAGLDTSVKITGEWNSFYAAADQRLDPRASMVSIGTVPLFNQKKLDWMKAAKIKVEYDGDPPEELRSELDLAVMERLISLGFETGEVFPRDSWNTLSTLGSLTNHKGVKLYGNQAKGLELVQKFVSRQQTGQIKVQGKLLNNMLRRQMTLTRLDTSKIDKSAVLKTVKPDDWKDIRPAVRLSTDLAPWFANRYPNDASRLLPYSVTLFFNESAFPRRCFPGTLQDFGAGFGHNSPSSKIEMRWKNPVGWEPPREELRDNSLLQIHWESTRSALLKFYFGNRGTVFEQEWNHRLAAPIVLSSSDLPLRPIYFRWSPLILVEADDVDFSHPNNIVVLQIEQANTRNNHKTQTPLKQIKLSGPLTLPAEELQALICTGPGVKETKITGKLIYMKKIGGLHINGFEIKGLPLPGENLYLTPDD